jgi:hypothetical protein
MKTHHNQSRFITSFTNAVSIGDDGWGMIAPYGDFIGVAFMTDEHGKSTRQIAIQRVTKENVTQMINAYNASRRGLTRFTTAAPIYHGHADALDPMEARKAPDRSPKGVFAQIAARDNGFFGEPILTSEGAKLLASNAAAISNALAGIGFSGGGSATPPVVNWNVVCVKGDGNVNYNGTNLFFSNSTTCGIMEAWTNFQSSLPGNYGPTVSGIKYVFGGQYYYYSTPIVLSNFYPFAVTLEGSDPLSSKLVYNGVAVGTNCILITGGKTTNTYSMAAHVFVRNMGFSATNNVTNTLMEVDNCAWSDFREVNWTGWQIMTNQFYGVEMSLPLSPASLPQLGGLRIRTSGDHLTSFANTVVANLGWGMDIQADHQEYYNFKCSEIGNYLSTNQSAFSSFYPSNSIYSFSPALIVLPGLDATIFYAHNYSAGTFLINVGSIKPFIYNYCEESTPGFASFLCVSNGGFPVVSTPFLINQNGNGFATSTAYLVATNTSGVWNVKQQLPLPTSDWNVNGVFSVNQPGGSMTFGTNGLLTTDGRSLSNLLVPYLSFSNAPATNLLATFTVTNTAVLTTNRAVASLPYDGLVVAGCGTTAANGTYLPQYFNPLEPVGNETVVQGYGVFTNTLNNGYYMVMNEAGPDGSYLGPVRWQWVIEQGLGGSNVLYDNCATGSGGDPIRSGWNTDNGAAPGPTSVSYISQAVTTNYFNRLYVTGVQPAGETCNITNGGIVAYFTNGILMTNH